MYEDVARIIDVYSEGAERLYVFIDDLDRADPSKVAELMQTLGILLTRAETKLVYVLAFDREKVAAALAVKHKEIAGLVASATRGAQPLDFGQAFLEKLVQLPFRVPTPAASKLGEWVEGIGPSIGGLREVVEMVAPALGANPRRIKQFVNLMQLRLRVLGESVLASLSLHQLGKLTALEILYPSFVGDVLEDPELVNALLIGFGPAAESEAYRRWSARTELLELLGARSTRAEANAGLHEHLQADLDTSMLDLDLTPILRVVSRPAAAAAIGGGPVAGAGPMESSFARSPHEATTSETPLNVLSLYAREYERIRGAESSKPERTAKLDRLFDDMTRVRGLSPDAVRRLFDSGSAGARVAALASCIAVPSVAGEIVRRVLDAPRAAFETFQALRVVRLTWGSLPNDARHELARHVSKRWLSSVDADHASIWDMTRRILKLAEPLELEGDIAVVLLGDVTIRFSPDAIPTFGELANTIYTSMADKVRTFHYGTDWRLMSGDTPIVHQREGRATPGQPHSDTRSLDAAGIAPGSRLRVCLLRT